VNRGYSVISQRPLKERWCDLIDWYSCRAGTRKTWVPWRHSQWSYCCRTEKGFK